jgi:hypothetical protein
MTSIKRRVAARAARKSARHGARGVVSKLRRDPVRAGLLVAIGCAAGFLAGRLSGGRPAQA